MYSRKKTGVGKPIRVQKVYDGLDREAIRADVADAYGALGGSAAVMIDMLLDKMPLGGSGDVTMWARIVDRASTFFGLKERLEIGARLTYHWAGKRVGIRAFALAEYWPISRYWIEQENGYTAHNCWPERDEQLLDARDRLARRRLAARGLVLPSDKYKIARVPVLADWYAVCVLVDKWHYVGTHLATDIAGTWINLDAEEVYEMSDVGKARIADILGIAKDEVTDLWHKRVPANSELANRIRNTLVLEALAWG